jgi:hypothetical protein
VPGWHEVREPDFFTISFPKAPQKGVQVNDAGPITNEMTVDLGPVVFALDYQDFLAPEGTTPAQYLAKSKTENIAGLKPGEKLVMQNDLSISKHQGFELVIDIDRPETKATWYWRTYVVGPYLVHLSVFANKVPGLKTEKVEKDKDLFFKSFNPVEKVKLNLSP